MKQIPNQPIDLIQAEARLQQWRMQHSTPAKVAAQHRRKILDWVVESMAFEGEQVSKARLKALLKKEGRLSRSTKMTTELQ